MGSLPLAAFGCSAGNDSSRFSDNYAWLLFLTFILTLFAVTPARADDLVSGLSTDLIQITSNFTGTDIVLFGAIEAT